MSGSGGHSATKALEIRLANVLRAGVMLAAVVVLIGGAVYLARHGHEQSAYQKFKGEPANLRSLAGILGDVGQLRGRGIIQLGLLLLIATPVTRVVFAAYGFARQRDWLYVGITTIVLSLLSYALLSSA